MDDAKKVEHKRTRLSSNKNLHSTVISIYFKRPKKQAIPIPFCRKIYWCSKGRAITFKKQNYKRMIYDFIQASNG